MISTIGDACTIASRRRYFIFELLRILFEVGLNLIGNLLDGFAVALVEGTHKLIVQFLGVAVVVVVQQDQNGDVDHSSEVTESSRWCTPSR